MCENKINIGFKVFVGQPFTKIENLTHKILLRKFLRLWYVLIILHLTHKISIHVHSDKLCVVMYIDIDHVQLVMLPDHALY